MSQSDELQRRITQLQAAIEKEVNDRLPRKIGITAVNQFKDNFRQSGFLDGGLKKWKPTKAGNKPLTSKRNHLMSSIQYISGRGEIIIENRVPYASIHNEGGKIRSFYA